MKTFYVSLGIFLLTLVLIVCNAVYIHHITNELQKRLDSLPACERAGDALEALQAYWDRHQCGIELSVSSNTVWQMRDRIAEMKAASAVADAVEFELARALAQSIVLRVQRAECLTLENLF